MKNRPPPARSTTSWRSYGKRSSPRLTNRSTSSRFTGRATSSSGSADKKLRRAERQRLDIVSDTGFEEQDTMNEDILKKLEQKVGRRSFLKGSGLAAAAVVGVAAAPLTAFARGLQQQPPPPDE